MSRYSAGYEVLSIRDDRRGRPVLIDLWYPADASNRETPCDYQPGFGLVAKNAKPVEEGSPLIVLSHGAFGAARNYSWIAEQLARNGYAVAGISHYGESFIYGPQTIDPGSALQPWLRAQDCSFALDHLLANGVFDGMFDRHRVGALGHSSCGATALELVGAVLDLASMQRYCLSEDSAHDKGCDYARGQVRNAPPTAIPAVCDGRIRAAVALDPALGPGHTEQSLKAIKVPAYIVGAKENDFLPYVHHAGRYARLTRGAQHLMLERGEGHFVFLNEGQSDAQANGVALYKDRNGVSRAEVHEVLARAILAFLDSSLHRA